MMHDLIKENNKNHINQKYTLSKLNNYQKNAFSNVKAVPLLGFDLGLRKERPITICPIVTC